MTTFGIAVILFIVRIPQTIITTIAGHPRPAILAGVFIAALIVAAIRHSARGI